MAGRTSFCVLSSAFSEWCLIILMYVNALLSFFATKFASICKLPAPCILCSRLDHIFSNDNLGFYRDLFCHGHKVEISSLIYCYGHMKLASIHKMCENCLLLSIVEKKSSLEVYGGGNVQLKQLVASVDGDVSWNKSYEDLAKAPLLKKDVESMREECSCCLQPFRSRSLGHWLLRSKAIGPDIAENGKNGYARVNRREGSNKRKEESATHGYDRSSRVGRCELIITSESESEVPFSDDDDRNVQAHGTKDLEEEFVARCRQTPPRIINSRCLSNHVSDDMVPEKLIHPHPNIPEPSLSEARRKSGAGESCADIMEIGGMECASAGSNGEVTKVLRSIINGPGSSASLRVGRARSFKNVLGNKGSLLSPRVSEIPAGKDSSRAHGELKSRLSQISSSLGLEFPSNDMISSPRVSDASCSAGLQNIAKRISIQRNYSWLEPYDISLISEIEGESSIDRLKRQVEMDRKSMSLLYKELEEERSASAIAAHEAMAMINRLQEEKATMQMEALQYLREMEEQVEYDQEAIQKLNELLIGREREILYLEADLESYRKQFGGESLEERILEPLSGSEDFAGAGVVKDPLLGFEDEKVYTSECLRRLEKKLHQFSKCGDYDDESRDGAMECGQFDKKDEPKIHGANIEQGNALLQDDAARNGQYSEAAAGDKEMEHHLMNVSRREL